MTETDWIALFGAPIPVDEDDELEECYVCFGDGWVKRGGRWIWCPECSDVS